jgi:hypothetical protein
MASAARHFFAVSFFISSALANASSIAPTM